MADVYLMGDNSGAADSTLTNGYLVLCKFTCAANATVNSLGLYYSTDGNGEYCKTCLYADSAGAPGAFIVASASTACVAGWNYLAITPTAITNGTVYWLGFNSNVPRVRRHVVTGVYRYKALTYANAFPDPAGTGFTSGTDWVGQVAAFGVVAATGAPIHILRPQFIPSLGG